MMRHSFRWCALTAVVTGLSLAGVTGLSPAGVSAAAVPGVPSATFDPNAIGWLSLRDQSSAGFTTSYTQNRNAGYLVTDLDIEVNGTDYRVGSVWQRNTGNRDWRLLRDLTGTQFGDAWTQAMNDGMRLVDQETYMLNGTRRFAGVWIKNVEGYGWASYRGMTEAQLATRLAEQRAAGRMPVDVDQYVTPDGVRYLAAWVQNADGLDWRFEYDLTSAEFATKFDQYKAAFRMLGVTSVRTGAGQRYAGIWVENRNRRDWSEYRDMSAQTFANRWNRANDEGFRLVAFDRYETASGTRYAGVWRQNGDRPDWAPKGQIDTRVQRELDDTAVPGISVAVFQRGQARYLRGFGMADIDGNVWMDTRHVGSLASVSKAVAGVLTMRMVEQGQVGLTDTTRSRVPAMPAHHTHTVGNLLSNRGCVGHYDEIPDDAFDNMPYATALAASRQFWNEPLACTLPDYHYSTHGYTLLGAALESAGGTNVENLVRTRLTNAFGLGTLAPQDPNDTTVRRMAQYTTADREIALENNDWKTLGGGIDSSVADLARFGDMLASGRILTAASRTTMWTAPDTLDSYAYGWDTGSQRDSQARSHRLVAKDGSQPGALTHIRVYPDDGITIAVMMNDRSQESGKPMQSPNAVARDIGLIVLNSLP
ncbi:serine hydrolase [Actinomadura sp. 6N118]|uniref:serine hydrolase n=1 Tax=Actinomadura sp. 6N118 TaxID=3375151 RepID=UPI0037AC666F